MPTTASTSGAIRSVRERLVAQIARTMIATTSIQKTMTYQVDAVPPQVIAVGSSQLRIAAGRLTPASAAPPRLSTPRMTRQIQCFGGRSCAHPAQTNVAIPKIAPVMSRSRGKSSMIMRSG